MRKLFLKRSVRFVLLSVVVAVFSVSCSKDGFDPEGFKEGELGECLEYESANEALLDYAANSEYLKLLYLEITSEGFTKPLMEGDVEAFDSKLLIDFYAHMEHMTVNFKSYQAAADAFADAGFMDPETRVGPLTIIGAIGAVSTVKGLIEFGNYLSGSGKEGRKALAGTFRKLSVKDQTIAFRNVPERYRNGTHNAEEFIQMVEAGDLDTYANRVHALLCSSEETLEYGDAAKASKNGQWDVFKKVGTEGLNKGVSVALEAPGSGEASGVSAGIGMTLLDIAEKGLKFAKYQHKVINSVFTGGWIVDVVGRDNIEELGKEIHALGDRYKAKEGDLPDDMTKLKISAPKEKGKIAVMTRKSDPKHGYPTTYIAPVGKGTSEVIVEKGDYEIVVADKDGYVDTKQASYKGGRTYEEEFDTSKKKPGAGDDKDQGSGSKSASAVEKSIFGKEISKIEVSLKFSGTMRKKEGSKVTDSNMDFKFGGVFDKAEKQITKTVDKKHLIYELKYHSFVQGDLGAWSRYDNKTVIKVNRKTKKVDLVDWYGEEETESVNFDKDESGKEIKNTLNFIKVTEFTVDKPIGRDSGNWIMFWSDDPHLNAGIAAKWDDNCYSGNKRVITEQELLSIDYEGCVIQIYME